MALHRTVREQREQGGSVVGTGRVTRILGAGVFAVAIVVSLVGWRAATDQPEYEVQAIVGPLELKLNPVRVARTVSALDSGSGTELGGAITTVRPLRATRLTLVSAQHDDPVVAAMAANARAEALVEDLNRPGPTLATFGVLTRAAPPTRKRSVPGAGPFLLMGVIAGTCLAAVVAGAAGWARPWSAAESMVRS